VSHEAYSPVGYDYQADHYCLDCIYKVAAKPNTYGLDIHGKKRVIDRLGGTGYHRAACNCTEHRLDRMAAARGIDRMDEGSFDSGDFPKAIPYHNDLHTECGPEYYGYGPEDPEWRQQYCGATCARCHAVIDGTEYNDGEGHWETVCPVWLDRKEKGFQ
jgi:hypothetical protein